MSVPSQGVRMGNNEEGKIRVRHNAEPQHDGRGAGIQENEEARPHPAAEWARFQRACCTGCSRY